MAPDPIREVPEWIRGFERASSETESLRQHLSLLSEAGLRINGSLDFDVLLQGVLYTACALTEARYGELTPFEETGDIQSEGAIIFSLNPYEADLLWGLIGSECKRRG